MSQDSTPKPTLRTIEDSEVPSPPPTPTPGTPCSRTPAGQGGRPRNNRDCQDSGDFQDSEDYQDSGDYQDSQYSPRSETSNESRRRKFRIVDTDPRTVRFTFGQGKARVKEFADQILEEHGEKVFFYQNPETHDTFGYWKVYASSEKVLELGRIG